MDCNVTMEKMQVHVAGEREEQLWYYIQAIVVSYKFVWNDGGP